MQFFQSRLDWLRTQNKRYSRRKKLTVLAIALVVFGILTPIVTYAYYAHDIADPDRLMNHNNTGIVLLDKNGEEFYSRGVVKDINEVKLENISSLVPKALLASEDSEFYSDPGFSIKSIGRAMVSNVKSGDLTGYGGSTITQQLVKNNLLTSHKNLLRKYQEISMAVAIDRKYTKDQIMEMYLNSVYFGNDAFGIESAAKTYYGKSAKDLNLAESSMLVGILPAPSAYSPTTGDPKLAKLRQNYVLTRMVEEKMITTEQKKAALEMPVAYAQQAPVADGHAQHFALVVLEQLSKKYGEEKISRSGLRVTTTLDLNWQKTAEKAVADQVASLASLDARNGALTAIDPKNGEVRAMVGSADWNNPSYGKVNMALMPRQPGSSFKPVYYTEAIATKKITAATILQDKPTDFGGGYRPTNYDFSYHGDVTVRNALADSMNIPAVEVMQKVGVSNAVATAQRVGLTTINQPNKYGLSLALGTAEARLIDMTNVYATFAHQGEQFKPVFITEIRNKFGDEEFKYHPKSKRVMNKDATYVMSSILSDEKARYPLAGNKFTIGRPVAVKTGTTNDNKDAWTIGYTPSIAVGVWVGNNDSTPMKGVGGSFGAGPIWRSTITSFLKGTPIEQFQQPKGIIRVTVCNGGYNEYFIKGTEKEFKCADSTRYNPQNQERKREDEDSTPATTEQTAPTTLNQSTPTTTQPTTTPTTQPSSGGTTTNSGTTTGSGSGTGTGTGTGSDSGSGGTTDPGTTTPPSP